MGHPIHKHMSSGQRYDDKQAYNKKLSSKARLHYLENEEHDKGMSRYEEGMSRQASPLNAAKSAGRSGHPRHMQSGADNSGNPNAASPDEYWRTHQQSRHHRSAPKETEEAPSRKASPLNIDGGKAKHEKHIGRKLDDQTWGGHTQTEKHHRGPSRKASPLNDFNGGYHKVQHAKGEAHKGTSRKSSPVNNITYGDISGKTGYMGEAKYDMEYNAVDDITQGKGKADYGISRQASPLNNEGHGGKKGHMHRSIKKKMGKIEKKASTPKPPKKQK